MLRLFISATLRSAKSAFKSFFLLDLLLDQCRREETVKKVLLRGGILDDELGMHTERCRVCSKTYKRIVEKQYTVSS